MLPSASFLLLFCFDTQNRQKSSTSNRVSSRKFSNHDLVKNLSWPSSVMRGAREKRKENGRKRREKKRDKTQHTTSCVRKKKDKSALRGQCSVSAMRVTHDPIHDSEVNQTELEEGICYSERSELKESSHRLGRLSVAGFVCKVCCVVVHLCGDSTPRGFLPRCRLLKEPWEVPCAPCDAFGDSRRLRSSDHSP